MSTRHDSMTATGMNRRDLVAAGLGLAAASLVRAADPVTITYSDWHLAEPVWGRSLTEAFAEFERLNPGIKVRPEPVSYGQRDVRYSTALRAGRGPDVFSLDSNPVKQFVREGWLMDMTRFAEKEGGSKAFLADFHPRTLDVVTEKGGLYGVPQTFVPIVLFYNKPMLEAAGVTAPPRTWDEFRAAAKRLTKASQAGGPIDQWGTTIVLGQGGFDLRFPVILRGFGGDILSADYTRSRLDEPIAREAFKFVVDLINDDKAMPPGVLQVDANAARQLLATKRVGMVFEASWCYPIVADMNKELDAWNTLQVAPVPMKDPSAKHIRSTLNLKSLHINKSTPHGEAAWKLVNFLTDKQRAEKWYVDNNLLSPRQSVNANFPKIQQSASAKLMTQELDRSAFMPLIPQWPEINETLRQSIQAAVSRTKTTEQALADAHKKTVEILQRKT
jgi:ABC-type glycerol-3-phosphate transport system substrate-binding protein